MISCRRKSKVWRFAIINNDVSYKCSCNNITYIPEQPISTDSLIKAVSIESPSVLVSTRYVNKQLYAKEITADHTSLDGYVKTYASVNFTELWKRRTTNPPSGTACSVYV